MNDCERYTNSYSTALHVKGEYVWCNRERCNNMIMLQRMFKHRYPAHAVVVSFYDGTRRYVYCSMTCAATEMKRISDVVDAEYK